MKRLRRSELVASQTIEIPSDVWGVIFSQMRYTFLRACTLVCKAWHTNDSIYLGVKSLGHGDMCRISQNELLKMRNLESLAMTGILMKGRVAYENLIGLTNLKSLSLCSMPFGMMDNHNIKNLHGLTYLSLRGLIDVSLDVIQSLPNLKTLSIQLSSQQFDERMMTRLTNLTSLHIPQAITRGAIEIKLPRLKILNVADTKSHIGLSVTKLTSLERLNISGTGGNLPGYWLRSLRHTLTYLNVARTNTRIYNDSIHELTNLRELRIDYNSHIGDASLTRLTNLTALSIGTESFNVTERGISCLTNLQKLSLRYNTPFISVECINALPLLKKLYVSRGYTDKHIITQLRKDISLIDINQYDEMHLKTDSL